MTPEFIKARDKAIERTVNTATYEYFLTFCTENDIPVPVACPRERMAIVIYCYILNCPPYDQRAQQIKKDALDELKYARGFVVSPDGRALINIREDNRPVLVPPGLGFFPDEGLSNGTGTDGVVEGGSSLGTAGSPAVGPVPGNLGRIESSREQSTALPIRRGKGKAN